MDDRYAPALALIADIKDILKRLVEAVTEYQKADTAQRQVELDAESERVVGLPVEIAKYYETEERERPIRNRRETGRMWLERVGVGAAIVLAILTLFTLREIRKTTKATEQAAYDACVSAQISQRELVEAQKTNTFSQAMAAASIMQAAAEIDAEKAYITFDPRLPKPEELLQHDPNFEVVYSIKNDGKSAANDVRIGFKAILVRNDEVFKVNDRKIPVDVQGKYIPAGFSFPGTPEIGRPITPFIRVVDSNGRTVAKTSEEVQKVLSDSAIIAVIGYISYSDFAGDHEDRFCVPLWQMLPGTKRDEGSRPNEKTCFNYNYRHDNYAFTAKPPSVAPQASFPEISCPPPK